VSAWEAGGLPPRRDAGQDQRDGIDTGPLRANLGCTTHVPAITFHAFRLRCSIGAPLCAGPGRHRGAPLACVHARGVARRNSDLHGATRWAAAPRLRSSPCWHPAASLSESSGVRVPAPDAINHILVAMVQEVQVMAMVMGIVTEARYRTRI
jgi:hypothetical protein